MMTNADLAALAALAEMDDGDLVATICADPGVGRALVAELMRQLDASRAATRALEQSVARHLDAQPVDDEDSDEPGRHGVLLAAAKQFLRCVGFTAEMCQVQTIAYGDERKTRILIDRESVFEVMTRPWPGGKTVARWLATPSMEVHDMLESLREHERRALAPKMAFDASGGWSGGLDDATCAVPEMFVENTWEQTFDALDESTCAAARVAMRAAWQSASPMGGTFDVLMELLRISAWSDL